jgi:hypothetical protein
MAGNDVQATKVTASGAIIGARKRIRGYSILGGAGAGTVNLRDGTSASGTLRASIDVGSGQLTTLYLGGDGIICETGIYAELTGATAPASVTVFWG